MSKSKQSLISYLMEYHFETEHQAEAAVKLGIVSVNKKIIKRSGITVNTDTDKVAVIGGGRIFVSRGGYKLQRALEAFDIDPTGRVCLDIGASTGGFTDCMLQYGASHVSAIDTGYGQLDWKLRTDDRVRCVEKTNVRYLLPDKLYNTNDISTYADLIAVDVSFISVLTIVPALQLLSRGADQTDFVILIKPQFEAEKSSVGRGGVIKNPQLHCEILETFVQGMYRSGLDLKRLTYSPLGGGKEGNIEFLGHFSWPSKGYSINVHLSDLIKRTVDLAHAHIG